MSATPARAVMSKIEAELKSQFPSTIDCIVMLRKVKERLVKLGWQFEKPGPDNEAAVDVICIGYPGQYDGAYRQPDGVSDGYWIVEDPYNVGAGEVLCWRPKDWHV